MLVSDSQGTTVIPRGKRKLGADMGVAKVTPSWDRGRLARIGSAQRTRLPVSAMCLGPVDFLQKVIVFQRVTKKR